MKTDTLSQSFEPGTPLTLPLLVLRRRLVGTGAFLLAVLVVWVSMGSMAQPAPTPHPADDGWRSYQAETFAFSYPAGWTVSAPAQDVYRLAPDGVEAGTHIAVASLPAASVDLGQLERLGVAYVEQDAAVARHYLRIMPRTRLADQAAARVRFTIDLVTGERVEGLWVGVPQPDGSVLTFVLRVYPDAYFNGVHHTFKRLLASVTLEN